MNDDTSDLLKYAGDASYARKIHDTFLAQAREVAERKLNKKFRHRISVSEVVNSAMRSALSDVRNHRIEELNSDSFQARLITILKNKIVSAVRRESADKRSVDSEIPQKESFQRDKGSVTPDEKVALQEISTFATVELIKQAGGSTPLKVYIQTLGVLSDCPAPSIKTALEAAFPDEKIPSLRVIQLQIKAGREFLLSTLEQHGIGSDD